MTKYALIRNSDDTFLRQRQFGDDTPPSLTHKGLRWIPINITRPAFDPETQVSEGPVRTILPAEVTIVWTVRAKTQAEYDAEADSAIDGELLGDKKLKALALIIAELHGIAPAAMRDQLIAKYKTL